ncbi:MAG: hypothetical protein ACK40L_17685 [Hydrogenophaga sp.]
MSQTPPDTPVTPSPAAQAAAVAPALAAPRSGTWLLLLGLAVAVTALVMSGLLWQKLGLTQQELARRSPDSGALAQEARSLAGQADALSQELQARLTVAEVRLSEVSLQRSQLEELMLTLSRSRDDNLVQDLESALRLALQQVQLTGSAQPLVSALQAADQRMENDTVILASERWIGRYSKQLLETIDLCMQLNHLKRPQSVFALQKSLATWDRENEQAELTSAVAARTNASDHWLNRVRAQFSRFGTWMSK